MTKYEIIKYLYENNVRGDFTIEQMAEDLVDASQKEYKRGRLDALNELKAYIREMGAYDTADAPQTETHDLRTDTHECVSDTPQTETSKTIPLNEWLSFKEYVLEMDGEGGPRIFRIIPMSEYKLQNQELHTDCGWGEPK